jgi:hypothetical protein
MIEHDMGSQLLADALTCMIKYRKYVKGKLTERELDASKAIMCAYYECLSNGQKITPEINRSNIADEILLDGIRESMNESKERDIHEFEYVDCKWNDDFPLFSVVYKLKEDK